jgi:cytochrome P450
VSRLETRWYFVGRGDTTGEYAEGGTNVTQAVTLSEINLANPEVFVRGEQHAIFRLLRAGAPVHWNAPSEFGQGFWSITRYDDVMQVSRDPMTFISGKGITMYDTTEGMDPQMLEQSALGKMMIMTDPPRHVRLRRLVNKGFTPRMIAQLEPHVRRIVTEILDRAAPMGECDFVTDIAARLPLAVICDMMGVPQKDAPYMFELTNRTLGSDDPEYQTGGDQQETANQAWQAMFQYFGGLVMERRADRRDDLISVLVGSEIDGEQLTDLELLYFCALLILAGNETTRNATTGGMLALLEHPDQRARVLANPELLPTAIEEILRWTSPVTHMARVATRDTTVGGQAIREGDRLALWYPSANRDEAIFPDPERFDVGRTPNDHLAFGIGEHFCLGAGLARLELRVMFEELLRRLPDIELAGPVERLRSTFIGGIKHVPVRYAAAAGAGQ